jgi:hypothetical protein
MPTVRAHKPTPPRHPAPHPSRRPSRVAPSRRRGWGVSLRDAAAGLVLVAVLAVGSLRPAPTSAQLPVFDPAQFAQNTTTFVKDLINDVLVEGAVPAVLSGINYFMSQLAYKAAVALTSECPGQTVCWDSKSITQSVKDAANGAVGEFVGVLSDRSGLTDLGFDLCAPPELPSFGANFTLNLQLSLIDEVQPKPPRCDFNNLAENWDQVRDSLGSTELLSEFTSAFEVGQTPLSTATGTHAALQLKASADVENAKSQKLLDAAAGGGFSAIVDPVSGRIKSPAATVLGEFNNLKYLQNEAPQNAANAAISGQIASRSVLSVVPTALSVFGQTLLTRLWNNFADGLLSSEALISAQPDVILNAEGSLTTPGALGARIAQSSFLVPAPRDLGVVDPLLEFTTCPVSAGLQRGLKNCVMDRAFADAVRQESVIPLTVAEAIKQGSLHGDWTFVSAADRARDADPFCFQSQYCESNLKKLRAARIIPVGWELAASQVKVGETMTLSAVVGAFNDCNAEGKADDQHPWCHLIDPDWVLKAPIAYCRAQAYGPQLVSAASPNRGETCVDQPSCVDQDENGNCVWGYCTQEKRVWRFDGDQCPAQYNTCRTLTRQGPNGGQAQFLMNTVGSQSCTADNVGCTQYYVQQNLTQVASNPADDFVTRESRFLNARAENCNASDDGCTALVAFAGRQSLNLVRNGGFGTQEDGDLDGTADHQAHWTPLGRVPAGAAGSAKDGGIVLTSSSSPASCSLGGACTKAEGCPCVSNGYSCAVPNGATSCALTGRILQPGIPLRANTTYTLSARIFGDPDKETGATGTLALTLQDETGSVISLAANQASLSGEETTGGSGSCTVRAGRVELVGIADSSGSVRAVCNLIVTAPKVALATLELSGSGVIDDVQLEEGPLTTFHEGYGDAQSTINAKVAPDYLGCDGIDDPAQCANYAQVCRESEVGCQLYSPTNGDPSVPAIVAAQDRCPAECVGYDTFKQEATDFDAERFPVYFIPSSARSCSEAEVGCSEFTNVATEAKSYYAGLRLCQKPDAADSVTYYSWEGSDTTGFQLRVWTLKQSNRVANSNDDGSDIAATGSGSAGRGPCTTFDGQTGSCVDAAAPAGACTRADLEAGNFDCREFYDADGNRHYRLLSKTILATDDCETLRATSASEADCAKSSGRWDGAANICTYQSTPSESRACAAQSSGCRAYSGDLAATSRALFTDAFEDGITGWTGNGVQSPEAVTVGGHSLKVAGGSRHVERSLVAVVANGRTYGASFWARGTGTVSLAIVSGSARVPLADTDAATSAPQITLTPQWRQYVVGPGIIGANQLPAGTTPVLAVDASAEAYLDNVLLRESPDQFFVVRDSWTTPASCNRTAQGAFAPLAQLGCREYTDTNAQKVALKSVSSICREQAVGCGAFGLTRNTVANPYAEIFNASCTISTACNDGAGCACNYALQNPAGGADVVLPDVCRVASGQTSCKFNLDSSFLPKETRQAVDAINVPADVRAYLVVRPQDACDASAISCRAMGKPHLSFERTCTLSSACSVGAGCGCTIVGEPTGCTVPQGGTSCVLPSKDGVIDRWDVIAKKDDPTKYSDILCGAGEVGCAAWSASDGQFFFKDPGDQMCEFRENVTFNGKTASGWFRKSASGAVLPCYPNILKNGDFFDIAKNGDAQYQGWVGACKPEFDRCEEFIDPLDTAQDGSQGKPYYFLLNNKLDTQSCAGNASLEDGCVLFNRSSVLTKNFSAAATYFESEQKFSGRPTPAVDCSNTANAGNVACAKRCVGISNGACSTTRASCSQNSDCAAIGGVAQTCVGNQYFADACTADSDCNLAGGERCRTAGEIGLPKAFGNDANLIIRVRPDRACAQWFSCSAEQTVYDTQRDKWRSVCTGFDLCEQSKSAGQSAECARWVDPVNERLTREAYSARDVSWRGREYSGFSIPNAFPLSLVRPVTIDKPLVDEAGQPVLDTDGDQRVIKETRFGVIAAQNDACVAQNGDAYDNDCPVVDGTEAACVKGLCVRELTGAPLGLEEGDYRNRALCRAYPEADSPFPRGIIRNAELNDRRAAFQGANVCEDGGEQCECTYQRATYGQALTNARFVGLGSSIAQGVCTGGPNAGDPCTPEAEDEACGKATLGGICVAKTGESQVVGWQGLCVDFDPSITLNGDDARKACNLWLPVDQLAGAPDVFNQNFDAGFRSPSAQLLYCQAAQGNLRKLNASSPSPDTYLPLGISEDPTGLTPTSAVKDDTDNSKNSFMLQVISKIDGDGADRNEVERTTLGFDTDPTSLPAFPGGASQLFPRQAIAGIRVDFVHSQMANKFMYLLPGDNPNQWTNGGYFNITHSSNKDNHHNLGDLPSSAAGAIVGNLSADPGGACLSMLNTSLTNAQLETICEDDVIDLPTFNGCFAMRANFTTGPQPALSGITSVLCADRTDGDDINVRVPVKITIQMKEQCSDLALVHDQRNGAGTDAALPSAVFTDVYHSALATGKLFSDSSYPVDQPTSRFNDSRKLSPFGPAGFKDGIFRDPAGLKIFPIGDLEGGSVHADQVAFNATGTEYVNAGGATTKVIGDTVAGNPFACQGPCKKTVASNKGFSDPVSDPNGGAAGFGRAQLQKIFAVGFARWRANRDSNGGEAAGKAFTYERLLDNPGTGPNEELTQAQWDLRKTSTSFDKAPKVLGVDIRNCDADGRCPELGPGITVNNSTSGTVEGVGGRLKAVLRYYAYADKDHMPIRRKVVDFFGSGSEEDGSVVVTTGFYKNHRGIVRSPGGQVSEICSASSAEFGKTPESCDTYYFEESRTYICNDAMLAGPNALQSCSSGNGYPCQRDNACVFQPRVQVMDGWGACNGNCTSSSSANAQGVACINDTLGVDDPDDGLQDFSLGCNWRASDRPWTTFTGEIVVKP